MAELGIVDIREINKVIKSLFNYDFSNHALTYYKQRIERIMQQYQIATPETIIRKLTEEKLFFDIFLHDISVPSTEMFRDPSLWRWLREEYFLNQIDKGQGKLKIWLPACVSGGELYSLAILLEEMSLLDKVQITASCISDKSIEIIKSGVYDLKKIEVSEENYKRFNGQKTLSAYYTLGKDHAMQNTNLIANVEFRKHTIDFDNPPQNIKLILFRNNLIYYNPTRQDFILQTLHRSLSVSGYLILGIREKISAINTSRDFEYVNETESIYRKKI